MNKTLLAVAASLACLLLSQSSSAEFVVEVTRGQDNAIPIAVVPFLAADSADSSLDAATVVGSDLARSGRFKTMDRKDMVEQPHAGAGISFDDWRRLGNDYILVGQMQPQGTDRYTINFELYNVLTRQRLLGYQISANRAGPAAREPSDRGHGVRQDPGDPRRLRDTHRVRVGARDRSRIATTGSSSPTPTARIRIS